MAGTFPTGGYAALAHEPKDYEPGLIEDLLLNHVRDAEYEKDRAAMSGEYYFNHEQIRLMYTGHYRRFPNSNDKYADLYLPILSILHEAAVDLVVSRLIPDANTMDHVVVRIPENLSPEVYRRVIEESADFSEGVEVDDFQTAHRLVEARATSALRRLLARNNFRDFCSKMSLQRRRYGWALGVVRAVEREEVDDDTKTAAVVEDWMRQEASAIFEEYMKMTGAPGADGLEATTSTSGRRRGARRVRFAGIKFDCLPPFNVSVGDLYASNLSSVPYFSVYNTMTYQDLAENAADGPDDDPYRYRNVEFISPISGRALRSTMGTNNDRSAPQDSGSTMAKRLEVPMRFGRLSFQAIAGIVKARPGKRDWESFAAKFGLTLRDLETHDFWCIQWVNSGSGSVLLSVAPDYTPVNMSTGVPWIESVRWEVEGMTFAQGDYEKGGAPMEVIFNNALASNLKQNDRTMDPSYAYYEDFFDREWMQENNGEIPLGGGRLIKLAQPMSGDQKLLVPMSPSTDSIGSSDAVVSIAMEFMRMFTGVSAQMQGGRGTAKSATEVSAQSDYLERQLQADQAYEERTIHLPAIRSAYAILRSQLEMDGEMEIVPSEKDRRLFGDTRATRTLSYVLQAGDLPEAVNIELLTSSSFGNKQDRIVFLERFASLVAQYSPQLMAEGVQALIAPILEEIAKLMGVPEWRTLMTQDELQNQMALQAQINQITPQASPTGGAGQPRPGYDRNVAETGAPREPVPGMPPMSTTPGVRVA